ncbi:hypothetical protein N9L68_00050 [bacterium]|nr:hypothetical protein [bacterium]
MFARAAAELLSHREEHGNTVKHMDRNESQRASGQLLYCAYRIEEGVVYRAKDPGAPIQSTNRDAVRIVSRGSFFGSPSTPLEAEEEEEEEEEEEYE